MEKSYIFESLSSVSLIDHEIDVDDLYNPNDEEIVNEVLTKMGFPFLHVMFKQEQIDMQVFKLMSYSDIVYLLQEYPRGYAIRFQQRFSDWKKTNFIVDIASQRETEDLISQPSQQDSFQNIKISNGIINTILAATEKGRSFLESVNDDEPFSKKDRATLMQLLLAGALSKNLRIRKDQFFNLSREIENTFAKEKSSSYADSNGSGPLYYKYTYMLATIRKSSLAETSSKKKISNETNDKTPQSFNTDEFNSNEFVKTVDHSTDLVTLQNHWRKSSRIRIQKFKNMLPQESFGEIYKILKRVDGHTLISIDFALISPDHSDFKTEWKKSENKMMIILKRDLPKDVKGFIFKDNNEGNAKDIQLIMGLHHYLYSPKTTSDQKKNQKVRPTIQDTMNTFFIVCPSENGLETALIDWRNSLIAKGIQPQIIIVGFGTNIYEVTDKFCVAIEGLRYTFQGEESFISAMECALKAYFVFNLQFPCVNMAVHEFLSQKYFKLEEGKSKKMKLTNKVNILLNYFET